MTLPNTLNQFHNELVFSRPLYLPLPRLVVRLSADAEPVTGRPLINSLYRRCLRYDFFPKFFLRSMPND
jgi:hypothetical protein